MLKIFKALKSCKKDRKYYRIKFCIRFEVDNIDYIFALLPTILWTPWIYRHHKYSVVNIWWLRFHMMIGQWEHVSCTKCVHLQECIKKRLYIFDEDYGNEVCTNFESR